MNSLGSKNSLGNLLAHWLSCVCFALNILGRKANLISELWGTPERQTEIQFSICPGAAQEERKQPGLHIQVVTRPCVHRPLPLLRVECEDAGGRLGSVGANCTHLGLRPEWKRKDDRVLFLDACSRLVLKIKNPSESGGFWEEARGRQPPVSAAPCPPGRSGSSSRPSRLSQTKAGRGHVP